MKAALLALLVAISGLSTYADTIQVTVGGNLYLEQYLSQGPPQTDPFDGSVIPPTQGTLTFTYDSTAQPSTYGSYESIGNTSLIFGDYSETVSPVQFSLGAGSLRLLPSPFSLANGVEIVPIVDIFLVNQTSPVTLSSLQTLTFSQINATGSAMELNPFPPGGAYEDLFGSIDDFSVTDLSIPEPSTWALLLCGLGFIGLMVRRCRVSSSA